MDVSPAEQPPRSKGWSPPVELPAGLDELRGPTGGIVYLPIRVAPNAPFPELVEWDIDDVDRRVCLYEIVLRDSELADQRTLLNGSELVALWDRLWLPMHIREAWQPLIDLARAQA